MMSLFSYLQPNLMSTEELQNHLKLRFPSQNVSGLKREELLRLFAMYAVPKARRTKPNEDVEMKPVTDPNKKRDNEHKRSRHQMVTAPTVETVTNACKKIRLINTERNKRQCEPSSPMKIDDGQTCPPIETKRKKITWP